MPLLKSRRYDIDGLRAVAAFSVLWFHLFPTTLPGGFAGVDVFFVISGFVVTNSIALDVQKARFSYADFFFKRIRRLFPGIILVVSFCLVVAWAFEFKNEFKSIAKDAFYSAIYVVNFHFARATTGYFDTPVAPSPLLHLWSLAVEEQYYFVWPFLFLFLLRLPKRAAVGSVLGILSLSALSSALISPIHPKFAFYMLPTRMWEFMLGALLILWPEHKHHSRTLTNGVAIAGVIGLAISCFLLNGGSVYPGFLAFLPTGATALLLLASGSYVNHRFLSATPMIWFGARSYQIYLWHWPLLIFYPAVLNEEPTTAARVLMLGLTILAAHVTYSYAEAPFRRLRGKQLRMFATGCVAVSMIGAVIAAAAVNGIITERLPSLDGITDDWFNLQQIEVVNPGKSQRVVFFGDSYIQQFYPRIRRLSEIETLPYTVVFVTRGGCAVIPGFNRSSDRNCLSFVDQGFDIASQSSTKTVLIGSSWLGLLARGDYYEPATERAVDLLKPIEEERAFARLGASLGALTASGKAVYVLLTPPGGRMADPRWIARSGIHRPFIQLAAHRARVDQVDGMVRKAAHAANAHIIDPANYLCNSVQCNIVDATGAPIYKDSTHLRASYVARHIKFFDPLVTEPH
jgi:peptidoglycan/LPS O-acetylase OafA/YrhL